jgi:hypothetical protein
MLNNLVIARGNRARRGGAPGESTRTDRGHYVRTALADGRGRSFVGAIEAATALLAGIDDAKLKPFDFFLSQIARATLAAAGSPGGERKKRSHVLRADQLPNAAYRLSPLTAAETDLPPLGPPNRRGSGGLGAALGLSARIWL